MKLKSTILLLLLIATPIALLSWLGVRLAHNEEAVIQTRFHKLLTARLADVDGQVSQYIDGLERSLRTLTDIEDYDPESLRELVRSQPDVTTLFVMDAKGGLVYPSTESPNRIENNFLVRASQVLIDKDLFFESDEAGEVVQPSPLPEESPTTPLKDFAAQPMQQISPSVRGGRRSFAQDRVPNAPGSVSQRAMPQARMRVTTSANTAIQANSYSTNGLQTYSVTVPSSATTNGWISWFWGRGVHLIYWQRRSSGYLVGVEVDRSRLIANIIGSLPETPMPRPQKISSLDDYDSESMIRLVDSSSRVIYQWGQYDAADETAAFCEIPVSNPLSSWRLKYYAPIDQLTAGAGRGIYLNLVTGLIVATLGLGALGFFAFREYSRDMREAAQRVSFVNQVSHELKTPLTNIRMYADLLDNDLDAIEDEVGEGPRGRLDVIQSESQRLSRLIGNVLTLAGQKRKSLQLQKMNVVVDDIIHETLRQFRPSLQQSGIETEFIPGAAATVLVDPDAIEQIIGNLINNVEKYAADGGRMLIASRQADNSTTVEVRDFGAGVDPKMRKKIFLPFARASDSLSRAAGTGIGLSIAQELARLHNGDLVLVDCEQGACFQLQLPTAQPPTTQPPTSQPSDAGTTS